MNERQPESMPGNGQETGARLSGPQAADLADYAAQLAKAGLPLAPGFRAMAEELPRSRLAGVLRRIADRLDAGAALDAAMAAEEGSFPAHFRGLVIASARSGRLAAVLERFVVLERNRAELRRRVVAGLAYPALLLAALLVLFSFVALWIVPQFRKIFEDFGAELPSLTRWVLAVSQYGVWCLLGAIGGVLAVWLILRLVAPAAAVRLGYLVPVVGPMAYWSRITQFSRMMELLLEQQVPAPQALRLCAEGLREPDLANGCRQAAATVESGSGIAEALAGHRQFPPTLTPFLQWGQKTANLPAAFQAAAEAFEARAKGDMALLEAVLLPVTLLAILSGVGFLVMGLFLPLISLIQNLT